MRVTYYVAVILWPLLIIDIVIQGFRWLIIMADKGPYWDMTFFAHYGFAMLLICIIYGYRP